MPESIFRTAVLVSAMRSRRGPSFRLLSMVGRGAFDICLSVPLLFEYEDVLARITLGLSRSAKASRVKFEAALSRVPDIEPDDIERQTRDSIER